MIDVAALRAMVADGASGQQVLQEVEAQLAEGRPKRARQLPPDWSPSDRGRMFARSHGFDEWQIAEQAQRFRDHAAASGRRQVDWDAAWRMWITSPYQRGLTYKSTAARPMTPREERQEETYRVLNTVRQRAYNPPQPDEPAGGGASDDPPNGELPFAKPA